MEDLLLPSQSSSHEAEPHAQEEIGEDGSEDGSSDDRNVIVASRCQYDEQDELDHGPKRRLDDDTKNLWQFPRQLLPREADAVGSRNHGDVAECEDCDVVVWEGVSLGPSVSHASRRGQTYHSNGGWHDRPQQDEPSGCIPLVTRCPLWLYTGSLPPPVCSLPRDEGDALCTCDAGFGFSISVCVLLGPALLARRMLLVILSTSGIQRSSLPPHPKHELNRKDTLRLAHASDTMIQCQGDNFTSSQGQDDNMYTADAERETEQARKRAGQSKKRDRGRRAEDELLALQASRRIATTFVMSKHAIIIEVCCALRGVRSPGSWTPRSAAPVWRYVATRASRGMLRHVYRAQRGEAASGTCTLSLLFVSIDKNVYMPLPPQNFTRHLLH
ncbi:hypothetical protein MRB53_041195 [Persea americana]|nr:hypothetical protein MRB53_041195 [Persea americana]